MTDDKGQEQAKTGGTESEEVQVDEKPAEAETADKPGEDREAEAGEGGEKQSVADIITELKEAIDAGIAGPRVLPAPLAALMLLKGYSLKKIIGLNQALKDIENVLPDDGEIIFSMVDRKTMEKFLEYEKAGNSAKSAESDRSQESPSESEEIAGKAYMKFDDCRPSEMVKRLKEAILEQAKSIEHLTHKIDLYEMHTHDEKGEGEPQVRMFSASRRLDTTMPHAARWRLE